MNSFSWLDAHIKAAFFVAGKDLTLGRAYVKLHWLPFIVGGVAGALIEYLIV